MNDYASRKATRIERMRDRALRLRNEADSRFRTAESIGSAIPFGQPILVGHHSERGHRRALERIDTNMRKGIEAADSAKDLERRAAVAESNRSISSDNPEAVELLEKRIAALEDCRKEMKRINTEWRKTGKINADEPLKSEAEKHMKFSPYAVPFPPYSFQNMGQNIIRLKKRVEILKKRTESKAEEKTNGEIRILQNPEENRTQIFFPSIPKEATRMFLKAHGFHFARYNSAWQRFLSPLAFHYAEKAAEMENGTTKTIDPETVVDCGEWFFRTFGRRPEDDPAYFEEWRERWSKGPRDFMSDPGRTIFDQMKADKMAAKEILQ